MEVSTNGSNWTEVKRFMGRHDEWEEVWIDLSGQTCYTSLFIRFELSSDNVSSGDGWYLDDVFVLSNGGNTYSAGDLNADGSYYDENNIAQFTSWDWVITNDMDTTVASSNNTYDRIIINSAAEDNFVRAGVMNDVTKEESDHYLVYAVFDTSHA